MKQIVTHNQYVVYDPYVYEKMIRSACRYRLPTHAEKLYHEFHELYPYPESLPSNGIHMNDTVIIDVCNSMISLYVALSDLNNLMKYYTILTESYKLSPSGRTYSLLLKYAMNAKNWSLLLQLLNTKQLNSIEFDVPLLGDLFAAHYQLIRHRTDKNTIIQSALQLYDQYITQQNNVLLTARIAESFMQCLCAYEPELLALDSIQSINQFVTHVAQYKISGTAELFNAFMQCRMLSNNAQYHKICVGIVDAMNESSLVSSNSNTYSILLGNLVMEYIDHQDKLSIGHRIEELYKSVRQPTRKLNRQYMIYCMYKNDIDAVCTIIQQVIHNLPSVDQLHSLSQQKQVYVTNESEDYNTIDGHTTRSRSTSMLFDDVWLEARDVSYLFYILQHTTTTTSHVISDDNNLSYKFTKLYNTTKSVSNALKLMSANKSHPQSDVAQLYSQHIFNVGIRYYGSVLQSLVQLHRLDLVLMVTADMKQQSIPSNSYIQTILIAIFNHAQQFDQVKQTYYRLIESRVGLNHVAVINIIDACKFANEIEFAYEVYNYAINKQHIIPDSNLVATMLELLSRQPHALLRYYNSAVHRFHVVITPKLATRLLFGFVRCRDESIANECIQLHRILNQHMNDTTNSKFVDRFIEIDDKQLLQRYHQLVSKLNRLYLPRSTQLQQYEAHQLGQVSLGNTLFTTPSQLISHLHRVLNGVNVYETIRPNDQAIITDLIQHTMSNINIEDIQSIIVATQRTANSNRRVFQINLAHEQPIKISFIHLAEQLFQQSLNQQNNTIHVDTKQIALLLNDNDNTTRSATTSVHSTQSPSPPTPSPLGLSPHRLIQRIEDKHMNELLQPTAAELRKMNVSNIVKTNNKIKRYKK